MKILQVADRPGWAIDRLSKPLSEIYDNVDMSYFSVDPNRYLDSGYSDWKKSTQYTHELGNKYDVIHFHRLEAAIQHWDELDKPIRKILTVHTERHADFDDKRLLLFDDIICPTKHAYDRLKYNLDSWKGKNTILHQVPYGIDLNTYKKTPMPHHVPHGVDIELYNKAYTKPKENEIGYVGRVVPWKRYSEIQMAAHKAGLRLIGCGYIEKGELQNVHNLTEGVDYKFTSFLPEPLMPSFYSRMNSFICLSEPHIEAGPLPVLEAMACQTPVISTRVGWAVDHCEHLKDIYFIEQDEIDSLYRVIKMLYEDRTLCEILTRNARKLIEKFSIQDYAKNLMNIYETKRNKI